MELEECRIFDVPVDYLSHSAFPLFRVGRTVTNDSGRLAPILIHPIDHELRFNPET